LRNWPLILTCIIAFAAFAYGMSKMVSPEMYREIAPPALGYVFVPDDDTFINTNHYLEVGFIQLGAEAPARVTAWISRSHSGTSEPLEFESAYFRGEPTDKWFAVLPPLEDKGDRWFYYLTIETTEGREIDIWKSMNWFEKLFSGSKTDRQLFWVTYEGNVVREMPSGKAMLVTHIVLTIGSLFFMLHTLYLVLTILVQPVRIWFIKAYKALFWAWLTFLVGAIILGIPITAHTFGVGFMPWPTQGLFSLGDITDTKSTLLVIWWGVLLLCYLGTYRSASSDRVEPARLRRFSVWTIVAIFVTVLVFLIPHSQFMRE